MVPTPQENGLAHGPGIRTDDGDRVVISGISGLYPKAHHIKELEEILYNKINPVTDDHSRWTFNHPEVRQHTGMVPRLELLDAQFFKVHYRLANAMDVMGRLALEQSYQAIYDAGLNPEHLYGKKVGVYIGSCFSETEKVSFYVAGSRTDGFGITGCSKTMFANRISYWLNAKGPSMGIDGACCSGMTALEQAYLSVSRGECEAAVVGGAHLTLHPHSTVHFGRIITLCPDGKSKVFDENADGCAKSEAVNMLFLQKAKDAKRIYAEILHVKSEFCGILEDETGPKFGFYRDPINLSEFLKRFYEEIKFPPKAIEYVEAFGSAVPEADKAELEALDRVFCKDRTSPLMVGSVMSNIGYGEAASGISAITKVLLAYHNGKLAGNLHCENPRQDVAALREGRMEILTDHRPFQRSYTAVNGFSVTGVNAHVLLNGEYKPKDPNRYKCSFPRLVTISGRQDTAVKKILDDLKSRRIDPEELALFHNIHQTEIRGHVGRGYTILSTNEEGETVSLSEASSYFGGAARPLWFVYSGMGSQWSGMGKELMRIPVFAAAIERCDKVLKPKGIDIVHIITSPDKTIFDNILHSFVGIAAVQIGLTDILTAVGIVPDKIIGHSVGELGCAYADGCFTAEEMILSAYSRGLVSVQTPFIKGSMAAVGIGFEKISKLVPPEIEVACHNGPESSTISGPAEIMKEFVAQLTAQGIFAKEVPCSNIAYHSRYIAEAGPGLLKYLSEVIKDPKPRSERWVSTSVPQDRWTEPNAQFSSAFYHTNNLLNQVLFEETSRLVPPNAVLIEIAPHGLLQAILKRSLPASCTNIPMTRKGHSDNVFLVLDAIGKLYVEGFHPKIQELYPKVEFPVSTGTPMLNHLVEWAHQEKWYVPLYQSALLRQAACWKCSVSIHDPESSYLQGHFIRGKNLYPFAAALVGVWDTLAMSLNIKRKQLAVEFRDVTLLGQPTLLSRQPLRLSIQLHRGNGKFEVLTSEYQSIANGFISGEILEASRLFDLPSERKERLEITADDVYKIFYERDCYYNDDFQSIHSVNKSLTEAQIEWKDNWVTFLDGILQLTALKEKHDTVVQPYRIRKLVISPEEHHKDNKHFIDVGDKKVVAAKVFEQEELIRCGGVLVYNVQTRKLPQQDENPVDLKALNFVPRFQAKINTNTALQVYLQVVAENLDKDTVNVVKISDDTEEDPKEIRDIIQSIPGITVKFQQMGRDEVLKNRDKFLNKIDLVLLENLSASDSLCQILFRVLRRDMYLINKEAKTEGRIHPSALYKVLSDHCENNTKVELIKWRPIQNRMSSSTITVRSPSDVTLLSVTRSKMTNDHNMIILTTYPPLEGLKEVVKKWRKEAERNQIYMIIISENDRLDELPELDLVYNVLNNGQWGGEYLIPCQEPTGVKREKELRSFCSGGLDSLQWVEAAEPSEPGVPVTVYYTAINNMDVQKASGTMKRENETRYCMDFSGLTDKGNRVMGLLLNGAASGRVKGRPELMWPVPSHWTLEDAATVPSAYAHAFYCLDTKVQLLPEHSLLVHGAAGALGQAVISIALAHGCEVFATVSDVQKKRFLMKLFPDLKEDHICNSRDPSFGDVVRSKSKKNGCDIIISCVKGYLKDVSLGCLLSSGVLLDIVQISNHENYSFGMYNLTKARHYMAVDFSSVLKDNNAEDNKRIQLLISEGIARGYVRPLSRVIYPAEQVSKAFRLVASSRHRGRVLLRLRDHIAVAKPRLTCSSESCHVVFCDESSFGLQLAERLINRGARKLHINCIKSSNSARLKLESWLSVGAKIQLSFEDLSSNRSIINVLTGSNRLGPVEGIYIIATDMTERTRNQLNPAVANIDAVSRKICPSVKHFTVINNELSVGKTTCLLRAKDGLPGIVLKLSGLQKMDGSQPEKSSLSWRSAIDATERALCSSQTIVTAHSVKVQRPTLLKQIATIADLEIPEEYYENMTLNDLGLDVTKVPLVSSFLHDMHNISLFEDKIPTITVKMIREIEKSMVESEFEEVHGLGCFFTYVDPDEILATTESVSLLTQANPVMSNFEWVDVNKEYLCLIPGMEGHHSRFRVLCERLKLPALVLQPGLDHLQETPKDLAERYAKILLKKFKVRDHFYLLGYESGVIVALEVAAILEDHGLSGTVFCLGGTPEEFKNAVEDELGDLKPDVVLQDAVVRHMVNLMTGKAEDLDMTVQTAADWRLKIEACVRMLLGRVAHSAQYAKNLMEATLLRVKQAREYEIQPRQLKSKLILLHASSLRSNTSPMTSLQAHSKQPVIVHELNENIAHAPRDLRCAAIINSHLSPELLKTFEEKDLRETYFLSGEKYLVV